MTNKIKSIILPDTNGNSYTITVGRKSHWRPGVVVTNISGGDVVEYPDHWERNWYSVHGIYDEKTRMPNVEPELILLSMHNPAYVKGVIYYEQEETPNDQD